jgi:ribosome recycling factor
VKLSEVESQMQKTVEATQKSFNSIRTGRANASVLDRVMIDYYGSPTSIKALATINTPDSSTVMIQPFDRGSLSQIEKAISQSDVGLTPNNDGQVIRLNVPPLTSERRKEFVKTAGKLAEEGRIALRNIRRDGVDSVKKQEKAKEVSEDESKDLQSQIQKLTDKYAGKIDELLAAKEKDIVTI